MGGGGGQDNFFRKLPPRRAAPHLDRGRLPQLFAALIFLVAFPLLCPFRFPIKICPHWKISSPITAFQENLNSGSVDCLLLHQGQLWTWLLPPPGPAFCQLCPQSLSQWRALPWAPPPGFYSQSLDNILHSKEPSCLRVSCLNH